MATNLRRGVERLLSPELVVDACEREQPIEVVLEAAFVAELFELRARHREIAGELGNPCTGEHRDLVDERIAVLVPLGKSHASRARIIRTSLVEVCERLLELELRGGLASEVLLAEHEELAGTAIGVTRDVHQRPELQSHRLVVRRTRVDMSPAADRLRELTLMCLIFANKLIASRFSGASSRTRATSSSASTSQPSSTRTFARCSRISLSTLTGEAYPRIANSHCILSDCESCARVSRARRAERSL